MHSPDKKELAKRMYVQDGMSCEAIASQLRAGKSTVEKWRTDGDWQKKRDEYVDVQTSFSTEAMRFSISIMKEIQENFESDDPHKRKVDKDMVGLFNTVLGRLKDIIKVEDAMKAKSPEEDPWNLPPELMADPEVQEAIKLITRKIEKHEALERR